MLRADVLPAGPLFKPYSFIDTILDLTPLTSPSALAPLRIVDCSVPVRTLQQRISVLPSYAMTWLFRFNRGSPVSCLRQILEQCPSTLVTLAKGEQHPRDRKQ